MGVQVLDQPAIVEWARAALTALGQARQSLDAVNVYPVADSDTGTNMYVTLEAATSAVLAQPELDFRESAALFAASAARHARGNSGIILAQLIAGWAHVIAERQSLDAARLADAAQLADEYAWASVAHPVEGTILSVSRACAQAATDAPPQGSLSRVVSAMLRAARAAVARTPQQLPVLRQANVVDAGALGYLVLLETLDDVVHGTRDDDAPWEAARLAAQRRRPLPSAPSAVAGGGSLGYEVMYLLDVAAPQLHELQAKLDKLGDSVAVAGGPPWRIHVHTQDPAAVIEAGISVGAPSELTIQPLAGGQSASAPASLGGNSVVVPTVSAHSGTAVVTCSAGPGLAELSTQAGAVVLDGSAGRLTSQDFVTAMRSLAADIIVVMPNSDRLLPAAQAAAALVRTTGQRVRVLPCRAQVQALAALAVHDSAAAADDDVVRMTGAVAATRDGAVTIAEHDALTVAGTCHTGDVLGLAHGDFIVIGQSIRDVCCEIVDRLLAAGGEIVTLVAGIDANDELITQVQHHIRAVHPEVDVTVIAGGQPRYLVLIGVE